MRQLVFTAQFKRDFKQRILSSADEAALEDVLQRLTFGAAFETRHRDHLLKTTAMGCATAT